MLPEPPSVCICAYLYANFKPSMRVCESAGKYANCMQILAMIFGLLNLHRRRANIKLSMYTERKRSSCGHKHAEHKQYHIWGPIKHIAMVT